MVSGNDLFISYSHKDRPFSEKLSKDLQKHGVKVWIDLLEMQVGDSLNKKIQRGISTSGWLAVILSPDSVASPWVEKELNAALEIELEKQSVFVLPLLYKECRIPLFLRDKVYADFRISYQNGLDALFSRLRPSFDRAIMQTLMSGSLPAIRAAYSKISAALRKQYEARIIQGLSSEHVSERIAALTSLFAIEGRRFAVYLGGMAADSSASVRRQAIFYLGELRSTDPSICRILSERMSDQNPEVRATARDAFRKLPKARRMLE